LGYGQLATALRVVPRSQDPRWPVIDEIALFSRYSRTFCVSLRFLRVLLRFFSDMGGENEKL
jgi:hypothetical protein